MSRKKQVLPFYLAVVDDDNKVFSIEGPMVDDTPWIDSVVSEQEKGKAVRCFTLGSDPDTAADELKKQYGWQPLDQGSILVPKLP